MAVVVVVAVDSEQVQSSFMFGMLYADFKLYWIVFQFEAE